MAQANNSQETFIGLKQYANGLLDRIVALPPATSGLNQATPSIVKTLQEIDYVLSNAQSQFRGYLNAISPVTALPPEILATIFDYYTHEHSVSATETCASAMSFSVLDSQRRSCNVSHVCRRWREIALRTASLWSAILLAQRQPGGREDLLSQIFLERSLRTPLDIEIPWNDPDTQTLQDQLIPLLGRVRTLKIKNISHTRLNLLAQLNCPAPMLETLQICLNHLPGSDAFLAEHFPQELPTLFAGQTPKLKHLDLDLFTAFSGNRFENLTYLRFDSQTYRAIDEVKRLFAVLEASPYLEQLSLRSCALDPVVQQTIRESDEPIWFSSTGERVALHHLRYLDFDCCEPTFVNPLMSQIKVPRRNLVVSSINCRRGSVLGNLTTIPDPNATSRAAPLPSITTVNVSWDRFKSVLIKASGPDTAVWVSYRDEQIGKYYWAQEDVNRYLLRTFPLRTLTELKLESFDERANDDWLEVFNRLSALKRLVLHIHPEYPHKWMYPLIPGWGRTDLACPAPKVSELCIYPPISKVWDFLVRTMRDRAEMGHPIDTIRVMLPTGLEGPEAEAGRKAFEEWKTKRAELEAYVKEVVFEEGAGYFVSQGVSEVNKSYMTGNQLAGWIS
ncbi:hypothetical protein BC629DRAFT_1593154 [Irpex lacteus]|nr:hypothetical protein BC629DRAFT_1593154 [Irpex lacteus]